MGCGFVKDTIPKIFGTLYFTNPTFKPLLEWLVFIGF
jgi:hypothetical protein